MLLLPAPNKSSLVAAKAPGGQHDQSTIRTSGHTSPPHDSRKRPNTRLAKRGKIPAFTLQAITHYLRLPESECVTHLAANKRFLAEVESRRTTLQSRSRLRRHLGKWRGESLSSYKELVASDPRSRIIATFHFGDFVFGMNYLLRHEPVQRGRIVLTQRISDRAYFDNMRRAFSDRVTSPEQQWLTDGLSAARLGERLRNESTTLVTFCDLPPQFGAGTRIEFLGRRAQFPRGAASLALRYQVPILPAICCYRRGLHHIVLAQQIEPHVSNDEDRSACVARLTRQLTRQLESFVRVYPWQWRFLASLPSYFAESEGAGTA